MYIRLYLLAIFSKIAVTSAVPNCCLEENIISTSKRCKDGNLVNLTCEKKFIVYINDNTTTLEIDSNQNLIIDSVDYYTSDKYCYANTKSQKEIYLVCFTPDTFEDQKKIAISVLQLISVMSFLWTMIIYLSLPQMMDLQGICILHAITGLTVSFIVLLSVNLSGVYFKPVECHLLAYIMYTSFLYAFFWLNILCFHLWRNIINPKVFESITKWKLLYHIYGIGSPLICLIWLATVHHWQPDFLKSIHPGIAETKCWFKTQRETMIYFYLPIAILLSLNLIFFIWAAKVLWNQMRSSHRTKLMKYRWRLYIKLFFIMGIPWIFEIIGATMDYQKFNLKYLWLITDILNSLQGLIILLILVVFRKKVVRALANKKIFKKHLPLPTKWRHLQDSECEEEETEVPMEVAEKIII